MTKWRWKIRYSMGIMLAMILVFLGGAYISNQLTAHYVITQQKAVIGSLYEQNPTVCEAFLRVLFEEEKEPDTKFVETALTGYGYTQDGVEYLYKQSPLKRSGDRMFLLQMGLAIGAFFCMGYVLHMQEKQVETQIDKQRQSLVTVSEEEIRIAREQAQKFVEDIAHQIKTPLACISLSLDMLQEHLKEESQKEKVQEAFGYLRQIERLMKRLLDIGRLESGKQILQKEVISLEELLHSCVQSLDRNGERIVLEVTKEAETEQEFYGDYDWLREAFTNLLKNALEHDASLSKVEVSLCQKKELIFVRIRDHGEGIRPEDSKRIFDRFYLPADAKKGHTGIGLNLAKLVIEKHFGTIEATNHTEGGVLVSICFPLYGLKNQKM